MYELRSERSQHLLLGFSDCAALERAGQLVASSRFARSLMQAISISCLLPTGLVKLSL